jgi:predicted unusual protein kinase regulating ubiquinone biosynthesis (AarF/ABC1/UbiB family)
VTEGLYSPLRVRRIFILLLTLFLLIRKRKRFLWFRPLPPEELRASIVSLGASFIKLAQVLATRADFFPPDYLAHLKTLHDELPPMAPEEFRIVFERAFGNETPFAKFNETPIASASIGQVHEAWLADGTKVAVKLRRLGIEARVRSDITILRLLHALFQPLFSHYTKNSIEAVVTEFSTMILQEVSLMHELGNLKKFARVYADCGVRYPEPYEALCCEDALVMSFMEGFRFDDKAALARAGLDFRPIIATLVDFYAEQMLVKGFFHADPHPGNLLINDEGELILLDFGMVKRIPNDTRVAIIEMIKSAHERDYELYVSSAKRLGTIAYEAPQGELAEFVERMFEIFNDESLSALSMQTLAFEILDSMRSFPFKLPQEAIYILRVSAIIEGLGTTYIENFNGIKDILPILQRNIPRALGAKDTLLELIIDEIKSTPYVMKDFKTTLKLASEGELKVQMSPMQLAWIGKEVRAYLRPFVLAFAAMLGAIFLLLYDPVLKEAAAIMFATAMAVLIYKK